MPSILKQSVFGLMMLQLSLPAAAASLLLTFGQIVDGTGEPLDAKQILVEENIIVAVGNQLEPQYPNAKLIDLSELTALPGLIDVHVHLSYGLIHGSKGDAWRELFESPAKDRLEAGKLNARATLATGVTTVRDLFAFDDLDLALKALIDSGEIEGPRIMSAGMALHPLTVPQGLDENGRVAFFKQHVAERAASGREWIKIFATSGSADDLSDTQHYGYPELKAATDEAHRLGLKVAVHSYGPSAVDDALRAGVDSIDHPIGLTPGLLEQWSNTGTYYVPTIDHNRYYRDHREEYGYGEMIANDLTDFVERNIETLRAAHKSGIQLAMGSDAVMSMFGQNTNEIRWFIEAGLPPEDIIRIATVNGADLLGMKEQVGRLKPGYLADIIAVDGDPLNNPLVIVEGVNWVMKDGMICRDVH